LTQKYNCRQTIDEKQGNMNMAVLTFGN
jgi:hypothetical protein